MSRRQKGATYSGMHARDGGWREVRHGVKTRKRRVPSLGADAAVTAEAISPRAADWRAKCAPCHGRGWDWRSSCLISDSFRSIGKQYCIIFRPASRSTAGWPDLSLGSRLSVPTPHRMVWSHRWCDADRSRVCIHGYVRLFCNYLARSTNRPLCRMLNSSDTYTDRVRLVIIHSR